MILLYLLKRLCLLFKSGSTICFFWKRLPCLNLFSTSLDRVSFVNFFTGIYWFSAGTFFLLLFFRLFLILFFKNESIFRSLFLIKLIYSCIWFSKIWTGFNNSSVPYSKYYDAENDDLRTLLFLLWALSYCLILLYLSSETFDDISPLFLSCHPDIELMLWMFILIISNVIINTN